LKNLLQEVQVEKVSDKIVEQLQSLIKEGSIAPGEKLPSERELIQLLGVGRSSLREALNKLETLGYVEIKKRKGIFVKSLNTMVDFDPLKQLLKEDNDKVFQLYGVRADIEGGNAYRAALSWNSESLAEIERCLSAFGSVGSGYKFSWQSDLDFHVAVAKATRNLFRLHVILSIDQFSKEYIRPFLISFAENEGVRQLIAEQHLAIYEAIKAREPHTAADTMREHLRWIPKQLKGYLL
jgi:DNA-binding FadR family transcriptional regulator